MSIILKDTKDASTCGGKREGAPLSFSHLYPPCPARYPGKGRTRSMHTGGQAAIPFYFFKVHRSTNDETLRRKKLPY